MAGERGGSPAAIFSRAKKALNIKKGRRSVGFSFFFYARSRAKGPRKNAVPTETQILSGLAIIYFPDILPRNQLCKQDREKHLFTLFAVSIGRSPCFPLISSRFNCLPHLPGLSSVHKRPRSRVWPVPFPYRSDRIAPEKLSVPKKTSCIIKQGK